MKGNGRSFLAAGALSLAFASAVFGSSLFGAARAGDDPLEPAGPGAVVSGALVDPEEGALRAAPYPRVSEDELLEAVNHDLFQPLRTPPPERYRFPSERLAAQPVRSDPRGRRGPELRIVGSAVMGDRAVALVQVDDSVPLVVFLGESVEGYTLAAVDPETATLVGSDETLTLPVVEPLLRGSPGSGPVDVRINARDMEQFRERMQDVLRVQMMNERGQLMIRGLPTGQGNQAGRGGRGGGGAP